MSKIEPLEIDVGRLTFSENEVYRAKKRRGIGEFFRKYFLEGQKLDDKLQKRRLDNPNLSFHERYRKYLAFIIPFVFFQTIWWSLAIRYNIFRLYPTRYEMAITMILGAFVSGATSEGGGAVAFPVMTLLLHIDPVAARDFSLMIQSCGMAASSFTVIWMRVKVEWHSIAYSSLGAFFSIILTLQFWDNILTGQQKKMLFVSIWFAFAISLLILNLQRKRITYDAIPDFKIWKAFVLFATGLFGAVSVEVESTFVATPTSVILMCLNTWVGFYWRSLMMSEISSLAYEYFLVSIPVVVTCSPMGAFLSSHLHRQVLASFVYILETLAVVGFLITKPPLSLIIIGGVIIIVGMLFFFCLSKLGQRLSERIEALKPRLSTSTGSNAESAVHSEHSTSIIVNND
ncbi:Protein of unknown function DUF81 domain containing protein [Aphelenchoides besseyi]|nr:Protein of unknown function DUF81 domain containing protein [Aphelenchoides besseyi]